MKLRRLQRHWDTLGKQDPFWAVLTWPEKRHGKWDEEQFFATGEKDIVALFSDLASLGIRMTRECALDFGCGVGRLTQALAKRFSKIHGVDIAPSMIALANVYNRYPRSCFYHLNVEDNLRIFVDDSFDFVCSRLTLQHMEPATAKKYIQEFVRILRPNGILMCQVPSSRVSTAAELARHRGFRKWIKRIVPKTWVNQYRRMRAKLSGEQWIEMYGVPRIEVEELLKRHGARILDVKEFRDAGPEWISFRYCVTKGGAARSMPVSQ